MSMSFTLRQLLGNVVAGDYCIGCGICAATTSSLEMEFTSSGVYRPKPVEHGATSSALEGTPVTCPFLDGENDEDTIARSLFASKAAHRDGIGYYLKSYVGCVTEGAYRQRGSSGGMGTWLCAELLEQGLIDGVLHVGAKEDRKRESDPLFEYRISASIEDVQRGAKSRYYPIELSDVLQQVRKGPARRYAMVGLPCFIKGVRQLALRDPVIRERIAFFIGIVCGHLKSAAFAEMLGWQLGVPPHELANVNFRQKLRYRAASSYGFTAAVKEGSPMPDKSRTRPMVDLFGGDWGMGMFKLKACEFCDDVLAETADVVVGDAWLPGFAHDPLGTNIVVVRHSSIANLIDDAASTGRLDLSPLSPDEVLASQRAGLQHRREGLGYRLAKVRREGKWAPPKRVSPRDDLPEKRKQIYDQREIIREASHDAFSHARAAGRLGPFLETMIPLARQYQRLYGRTGRRRLVMQGKKLLKNWVRRMTGRYCVKL